MSEIDFQNGLALGMMLAGRNGLVGEAKTVYVLPVTDVAHIDNYDPRVPVQETVISVLPVTDAVQII